MPNPRKKQKEIAERYQGNLRYFRLPHLLRHFKSALALGCLLISALLALLYIDRGRTSPHVEWLNSPGAISQSHAGFGQDCKQCHDPTVALKLLAPASTTNIDLSCQRCHAQHTFHQANVVLDHSCVSCHHEHQGAGPMNPVADIGCVSCHGNQTVMAESSLKGLGTATSSDTVFKALLKNNLIYLEPPRPAEGYTQVFQSFADQNHPDFQITKTAIPATNLTFSHEAHLHSPEVRLQGKALTCAACHVPDSHGAYMLPISFEKNCQACHSLQIDPTLAGFQIPHPKRGNDAATVRNFLLTLPTQYASYATDKLGMTQDSQIQAFVGEHMEAIRQRTRQGPDLLKAVFFADDRHVNLTTGAAQASPDRSLFPGCVYCHQVTTSAQGEPNVIKPVLPDRWLVHAKFNHAAHLTMSCEACHGLSNPELGLPGPENHDITQSTSTADVCLPDKMTCVKCHSTAGGVVSTCVTCHDFHNTPAAHDVTETSPLRQMMLGGIKSATNSP